MTQNWDKYGFFGLRNELDRNQFLLGNDNEWIIPDLFKVFYFEYLFRCSFMRITRTGLKQVTLFKSV